MIHDNGIDLENAKTFLAEFYGLPDAATLNVEWVGEGAWSRCFGFEHDDQSLVIKFSKYLDDIEKDRRAGTFSAPGLPIPQVLDVGQAFDGHYAIATRVLGVPLESVGSKQWARIVPSVVAALEAMRTADITATTGFGGWDADGNAPHATWSDDLLGIIQNQTNEDAGDGRGMGAMAKLAAFAPGKEAFDWGAARIRQVISDDISRSLTHGDLINRNVLVDDNGITGLFDWGCSRYGDHLYDLAWFEFWEPWHPNQDVPLLRSSLEAEWRSVGYTPHNKEARLLTCYLHIGLDHLIYNAYIDDFDVLMQTANRMKELCTAIED